MQVKPFHMPGIWYVWAHFVDNVHVDDETCKFNNAWCFIIKEHQENLSNPSFLFSVEINIQRQKRERPQFSSQ